MIMGFSPIYKSYISSVALYKHYKEYFKRQKKKSDYEKLITNNLDSQLFWFNVHASLWDIPSGLFEHASMASCQMFAV